MAALRTPLLLLLAALALSSVQAKKRGDGTAYSGEWQQLYLPAGGAHAACLPVGGGGGRG